MNETELKEKIKALIVESEVPFVTAYDAIFLLKDELQQYGFDFLSSVDAQKVIPNKINVPQDSCDFYHKQFEDHK
jgi:hypothetical protein